MVDYEKWVQQKNKIEDLKVRKVDIQKNICNIEHKITDLEQQMMTTEVEIQNKLVVKNNLVEQCRILEMKTSKLALNFNLSHTLISVYLNKILKTVDKLKHVHQMLLESRKLYEHYFSCSLSYEPPDKYNFSILKNNVKFGEIKFQYNEQRSRWAGMYEFVKIKKCVWELVHLFCDFVTSFASRTIRYFK